MKPRLQWSRVLLAAALIGGLMRAGSGIAQESSAYHLAHTKVTGGGGVLRQSADYLIVDALGMMALQEASPSFGLDGSYLFAIDGTSGNGGDGGDESGGDQGAADILFVPMLQTE